MASTNAASTSERDWPTLVVGAIFFLIGASLAGAALWQLTADARGIGGVENARGEVLRKAIHADRTQGALVRPRHRVEYRFSPARGEPVSAAADVAPELWARLEPGAPLEVRYAASDPATHRVEGEARDLTVWIVFGLGGVLFFLAFFVGGAFWLGTLRSTQELFELRGQPAEGTVLSKAVVRKRSSSSRHGSSESTHYQVVYRFRADGADVVGTSELDADDWERLKERGPIALTYVGGSPWLHRLEGEGAGVIAPFLFLGVGGLGMLGSGAATWYWGRGSPRRRAPKVQPRAQHQPLPAAEPKPRGKRGWMLGAGVGAVFFFAGCGALVEGVGNLITERRYAAEGLLADARIIEKSLAEAERGGRRSTEYAVRYGFQSAGGRPAEGRASLEVGAWEAARPGDRIRVRYLGGEPEINRPADAGGYALAIVLLIVGPLFALIGAFLAWGSWLARHDAGAQTGPAPER